MQVADIMHTDVKTAEAEDTFADVAKVMRSNGISSVVVLNGDGALAGIVTERDVVNLVAAGGDPQSVQVAHGMTRRHLTTWAAEELSGGHEMPDIERSTKALRAASELQKQRRMSS
jgi:CBS domain-containing protein